MRVFLLGLDGATFDLILPWAREGKLPNLASILRSSYFGELESLPPITPAGWTSIITGVNCGKHGLADFLKLDRSSYGMEPTSRLDRKVETIYNVLGKAGLRCIMLGYPMTYPAEEVNGFMVTGMMTPRKDDLCTYPPGMIGSLDVKLGETAFMASHREGQSRDDFLADIGDLTGCRERMVLHFIKEHDFDFLAAVFMAPDIVSHSFWKHMDRDHPDRAGTPVEELERFAGAIEKVYRQVDESIGRIMEALGDGNRDTIIMLVSDHGSGPLHGYVNINRLLVEKGYMTLQKGGGAGISRDGRRDGKRERGRIFRAISALLGRNRKENETSRPGELERAYFGEVDWETTRAFSWGNLCSITLNRTGREALGTVEPGEVDDLARAMAEVLRDFRGEDGKELVDDVGFREEVFWGPYVDDLPEMFMIMRNISYLGRGINPIYRDIRNRPLIEPADISGTHRVEGIYAISDICSRKRMIRRSGQLRITGKRCKVYDVAPTLLHIFGMDVPDHYDGKVIGDAFVPGSISDTK